MNVHVEKSGDKPRILFDGAITDTFDVDLSLQTVKGLDCAIDVAGILHINSTGVRKWVNFIQQVDVSGDVFENVSPTMVKQMSMMGIVLAVERVQSRVLPLLCCACGHDFVISPSIDHAASETSKAPDCTSCQAKGSVVFDDIPESYLGWLPKGGAS